MLLDHMRRRSDSDFARFRKALQTFNQAHVIDRHLDATGSSAVGGVTPNSSNPVMPSAASRGAQQPHPDDASVKLRLSDDQSRRVSDESQMVTESSSEFV